MFAHPIPFVRLSLLLLLGGCCTVHRLSVTVTAPAHTDRVVMVGNTRQLGNWDPAAAPVLHRKNDTTFVTSLYLKPERIEYKFTRGTWETEALRPDSTIPGNYRIKLACRTTLTHTVPFWRDEISLPPIDETRGLTGTIEFHDSVYSPQLDNYRTVRVWLPPDYSESPEQYYPVLYLQDGQNVFSPSFSLSGEEWALDETADEFIQNGSIQPLIMVAIDHGANRTDEYSPMQQGTAYSAFVIQTIKPWIDRTYRTLKAPEFTAVMGSSMGGIIAFHLAWEHPEVFGRAACLSPAFLVDDEEIVKRVRQYSGAKKPVYFILFNGTVELEKRLQPAITHMVTALERIGYREGQDYRYQIFPGARHTESAWAEQSRLVLFDLFGQEK